MSIAFVGYLLFELVPSPAFETLSGALSSVLLAVWIAADARRRGVTPCYDFGFLCYLTLPIATPWYCFWSRGWRGVFTLLLLAGIWLTPSLVANAFGLMLYAESM